MYVHTYVSTYVRTYVSHTTHTKEGTQMAEWCTVYVCTMQHEAYYKYVHTYVHHHTQVTSDDCVHMCTDLFLTLAFMLLTTAASALRGKE